MYEMLQELYRMFHSGGNLLFLTFFTIKKLLKCLLKQKILVPLRSAKTSKLYKNLI